MGALARANSSKDDEARDVTLAAIGHSDRVDIYWTTLIARLTRAIEQTKTISLFEAEVLVIGLLAAQAIPQAQLSRNTREPADAKTGTDRLQRRLGRL
jgi:hypothetical protein